MKKLLRIYSDGGARGNTGKAAAAFWVEKKGREIFSKSVFLGETTNNIAEYRGVILGLGWLVKNQTALKREVTDVEFCLDSELVANQINGLYRVKNLNIKKLYDEVNLLIRKIHFKILFKNISRGKNIRADFLVNQKLDNT